MPMPTMPARIVAVVFMTEEPHAKALRRKEDFRRIQSPRRIISFFASLRLCVRFFLCLEAAPGYSDSYILETPTSEEYTPMTRHRFPLVLPWLAAVLIALASERVAHAQPIDVEGQPLAANAIRVVKALEFLGYPMNPDQVKAIEAAATKQDAKKIQELLDPYVMVIVHLNAEARVKAKHGARPAQLQQAGYTPILIKVHNESTVTKPLRVSSPQALPIHSRGKPGIITDRKSTRLNSSHLG